MTELSRAMQASRSISSSAASDLPVLTAGYITLDVLRNAYFLEL